MNESKKLVQCKGFATVIKMERVDYIKMSGCFSGRLCSKLQGDRKIMKCLGCVGVDILEKEGRGGCPGSQQNEWHYRQCIAQQGLGRGQD